MRINKIIAIVILILMLPVYAVNAEEYITVEAETVTVNQEKNDVDVNIYVKNNPGIALLQFRVQYDETALELKKVNEGCEVFEKGDITEGNIEKNPYTVSALYAVENRVNNGILVTLSFHIKEKCSSGRYEINLLNPEAYNIYEEEIKVNLKDGQIIVTNNDTFAQNNKSAERKSETTGNDSIVSDKMVFTIGKNEVNIFGKAVKNDVAPIIRYDRTMIPARIVAENLGANVEWDETNGGIVTITRDDIKILIYINSDIAYVNGEQVKLDSPAFIENNRTYTPLRFVAENLGAKVEWNESDKTVTIIRE